MNTQARWPDGQWRDYGDVTQAEAARLHAIFFDREGLVETRWERGFAVHQIKVTREVVFKVIPLRHDEEQSC